MEEIRDKVKVEAVEIETEVPQQAGIIEMAAKIIKIKVRAQTTPPTNPHGVPDTHQGLPTQPVLAIINMATRLGTV